MLSSFSRSFLMESDCKQKKIKNKGELIMKRNNRKGFTTVELVIVIAVIAILATALIPTFGGLIDSANKTANEQEVRNIYRDYLAAKPEERAGATYYILVDDEYYLVDGGELKLAPVTTPVCGTTVIDSTLSTPADTGIPAEHSGLTDGKGTCTTCHTTIE